MSVECFILEDQAPARRIVENYLTHLPELSIIGSTSSPTEAASTLKNKKVDILFLDLGLPQQDGFEFLEKLANPPVVVVTTAYASRALEGFSHGVVDFLVKPFSLERFRVAVRRATMGLHARTDETIITIPIERCVKEFIPLRNIISFSADGDYVQIRTTEKNLHTLGPLTKWEAKLTSPPFVRIHRSHIINCTYVKTLYRREVQLPEQRLPVSTKHHPDIEKIILKRNLIK